MTNELTPKPMSPRQTLLGLFILFQLAFLIVSNLLGFVVSLPGETSDRPKELLNQAAPNFADENSHGRSWLDQLETSIRRWTQLTGQDQQWALFTTVGKATGFPLVVLVWDEPERDGPLVQGAMFVYDEQNGYHLCADWNPPAGTQVSPILLSPFGLLGAANPWDALSSAAVAEARRGDKPTRLEVVISDNEPNDIRSFVRYKNCRVRRFEGELYLSLRPSTDESAAATAQRVNDRVYKLVHGYHDTVHAYMRWRLKAWQDEHPEQAPPKQVLLFQRMYRIHGPDENSLGWDGPYLYPVALWRPDRKDDRYQAVEYFDYTDHRFHALVK